MGDSDDDYETLANQSSKRRGHSRNKFRKEREDSNSNNGDSISEKEESYSNFKRKERAFTGAMPNQDDDNNSMSSNGKHRHHKHRDHHKERERSSSSKNDKNSTQRDRYYQSSANNSYHHRQAYPGGMRGSSPSSLSSQRHFNQGSRYDYDPGLDMHGYKRPNPSSPPLTSMSQYYGNRSYGTSNSYSLPGRPSSPTGYYDAPHVQKKMRKDWNTMDELSSKSSGYYEHDNRLGTDKNDYSDEPNGGEYNRLSRPSNYSSYKYDSKHMQLGSHYAGTGNHHHHHNHHANEHYMRQMPGYAGGHFGASPSLNPMLNNQMSMIPSDNGYLPIPNPSMANGIYNSSMSMNFKLNQQQSLNNVQMNPMLASKLNQGLINPNERFFANSVGVTGMDMMGQTQPQMMSFKQFLTSLQNELENGASMSPELATKRYNDYKTEFRREQIAQFFSTHKHEEWFKCRYHPDDSAKRKDEQHEAIKRRLGIFMNLLENYEEKEDAQKWPLSLDMSDEINRKNLYKFLDACMIKLEDGNNEDLQKLDEIYNQIEVLTNSSSNNVKKEDVQEKKKEKSAEEDKESGMGSNDNSEEEDDDYDEDEEDKIQENSSDLTSSRFDRKKAKKKSKRTRNKKSSSEEISSPTTHPDEPTEPDLELPANGEIESVSASLKSDFTQSQTKSTQENHEKETNLDALFKTIVIPKKTQSIFFKHLPVNVTRFDLEEIGKRFAGFKRASISEPAPERRFQRRGWITFESDVNIKEVCSKINGIKLYDMLLNATINRELEQKVKCIIGLSNHKTIVRNDLKLVVRIVENMDKRWALWQHENQYSNNKILDEHLKLTSESSKKKSKDKEKQTESNKKKLSSAAPSSTLVTSGEELNESLSNGKADAEAEVPSETSASIVDVIETKPSTENGHVILKKNPLVEAALEYLSFLKNENIEEKKEHLNGVSESSSITNGKEEKSEKSSADAIKQVEADNENDDDDDSKSKKKVMDSTKTNEATQSTKPTTIVLTKTLKLEKDEKAAQLLDKLVLYLRIVHSIDYYNSTEYQQEDWMPNRCGILHVRGSTNVKSSFSNNIVNILNGININYFDANAIKKIQIDEWLRLFEVNIRSYVDYKDRIEPDAAKRLGLKEVDAEMEKFMLANCKKIEKDIWLCPLSGKKFKGPDYVRKHIETKHRDKLLELRKEIEFFNRFVFDPKRPYLPEHPLTKNMTNGQQQQQQPFVQQQQQQQFALYQDYQSNYYRPQMQSAPYNNNNNYYAQNYMSQSIGSNGPRAYMGQMPNAYANMRMQPNLNSNFSLRNNNSSSGYNQTQFTSAHFSNSFNKMSRR